MTVTRKRAQLPARDSATTAAVNPTARNELSQRIAALNDLSAQQLRDEWRRLYRGQPPRLSRDLLIRTIAYRMQELAYGGLSKATERKLAALTRELKSQRKRRRHTRFVAEAGRATGAGVARQDAYGGGDGRRVRICRQILSVPDQDRACHHRGTLVRPPFLRPDPQACIRWPIGFGCGWIARCGGGGPMANRSAPSANRTAAKLRCAIYTRKSSEEGLEQDFNSLDAQREACEAFIASQKREGWSSIGEMYDDGGFSGATMERPAFQRLLSDVSAGRIDVVVVYKVDRLTRSLSDFAKIVDIFDRHAVSFVSVTQQFNTTSSMGRLTLNILLSFAQFEREVTGERIRDKIAASKKKGMWMGGLPSLGYDVKDRKLVVNTAEAKTVRHIFRRYTRTQVSPGIEGGA